MSNGASCNSASHTTCKYLLRILIRQHLQEVRELAAVAVPQHLATSRVAQAAAGSRTHLTLTGFSLELLMGFLHSARLPLVLGVLNEHADFNVGTRVVSMWQPVAYSHSVSPLLTSKQAAKWLQHGVDLASSSRFHRREMASEWHV